MINPLSSLESYRKAVLPADIKDTVSGIAGLTTLITVTTIVAQPIFGRATIRYLVLQGYALSLVWFKISHRTPPEVSFYPKFINNQIRQVFRITSQFFYTTHNNLRDDIPPST